MSQILFLVVIPDTLPVYIMATLVDEWANTNSDTLMAPDCAIHRVTELETSLYCFSSYHTYLLHNEKRHFADVTRSKLGAHPHLPLPG